MFLRRLNLGTERDRAIASELLLASPRYELETFGRLPSAATVDELPWRFPADCAPQHRLLFAAFDREHAVGLAQIALHTPDAVSAAVLMLLVAPAWQKRHVGCEMVERLSRQARRWPGISSWYLGVLESNTGGQAFWRHCGFRTTCQGLAVQGLADKLNLMDRPIKARPACQHGHGSEDPSRVVTHLPIARLT
jgi:ribosomal protein S18 acetylase RimI-like enzyme